MLAVQSTDTVSEIGIGIAMARSRQVVRSVTDAWVGS
jgi:hypothetical protein